MTRACQQPPTVFDFLSIFHASIFLHCRTLRSGPAIARVPVRLSIIVGDDMDHESRGWRLIRTWDFGLLWWGQVTSQIGEGLNKVALLWFVYGLTGSAMKMTVVGLLQTVPPLLFGPLIGVYLDRWHKKKVMVWVDLLRAVLTFMIPALYAADALSIEGLYALIFLTSVVSTVFGPALVSAVPLLV